MTSPRRLLHDGNDFERELLASARLDVASARSCNRALSAISALASLGTATAGAGAAVGGSTGSIASAGLGVLVKWVGLGMIVGLGATGTAKWVEKPSAAPTADHVPDRSPAHFSPPRPAPAMAPDEASGPTPSTLTAASTSRPHRTSAPEPRAADTVAPQPTFASPRSASTASTHPFSADLTAEIAALAAVRASLASGDAPAALAELDAYRRAFPDAALDDEATVLRVNALLLRGDRGAATVLANRFLAAHPSSPHAPRLRTLAGEGPNP